MMRFTISFLILLSLPCLLSLPFLNSQFPPDAASISASSLDAFLQDYAFRAFHNPKTGVPYDGQVPRNLAGFKVSAMRLRSGSLRTRGVLYKEFQIPTGVYELPYVERLVLVYQNLGNWSENFYPLPGYSYLCPVLGLLAYSAANLSAKELGELDLRAPDKPILIRFQDAKPAPFGSSPKCVYFDLRGSLQFDIVLPGNVCSTNKQGHFSIVVESNALSRAPAAAPVKGFNHVGGKGGGGMNISKMWIIVASAVGGGLLLIMLGLLVGRFRRSKRGRKMRQMEWEADSREPLHMTSIGGAKVPSAFGIRTQPMLENDYYP